MSGRISGVLKNFFSVFTRRNKWRPNGTRSKAKTEICIGQWLTSQLVRSPRAKGCHRYTQLVLDSRALIERLIEFHNGNVEELGERMDFGTLLEFNENARCLFCIEIAESGS